MQAHRALIFKLIGLYCPKGEAADDAWNEIYIQVHGALGSFRGEAQASTWLYRVALNTGLGLCLGHHRGVDPKVAQLALVGKALE